HEKHLDLYNALIGSIHLDEAIAKGEIDPTKDSEPSKDKDQSGSSKAGKPPSKPSLTDKSVNTEETVHEVAMEADETIKVEDDVVNVEEQPQNDAALKQDNSIWFKQDARPETPDPEWHKVPNADDAPEQTWFHELKDKITKADLEGPAYNLLKGTCRNCIEERKYALSLTKTKAARYDLVGIEDRITRPWSLVKEAYDKNAELGIHH
ncbi:hypothetical protein Tco_1551071, partial [Tanacetum coccineum]